MEDNLTKDFYEKHKEVLSKNVLKVSKSWFSFTKSIYPPIIQTTDLEDVTQQVWVEVLEMPNFLPIEIYSEFGIAQAAVELNKMIPRRRDGEYRGTIVRMVPYYDEYCQEVDNADEFFNLSIHDRICLAIDLVPVLTEEEYSLYTNYLQFNRALKPREKADSRSKGNKHKHYTGWTQEELADIYCVSLRTLKSRVKKIKEEVEKLVNEGFKETN